MILDSNGDLCSTLGDGKMICVLAWVCLPPMLGVGAGRVAPSRGYYHREYLDILHKKSCIFVHICMILDI